MCLRGVARSTRVGKAEHNVLSYTSVQVGQQLFDAESEHGSQICVIWFQQDENVMQVGVVSQDGESIDHILCVWSKPRVLSMPGVLIKQVNVSPIKSRYTVACESPIAPLNR